MRQPPHDTNRSAVGAPLFNLSFALSSIALAKEDRSLDLSLSCSLVLPISSNSVPAVSH